MSRSNRVRFRDLRDAYRLIHDARDVGHDPAAWPRVLAGGMARLAHAQVAIAAEFRFDPADRPTQARVLVDVGWASPATRDDWYREIYQRGGFRDVPIMHRYAALPGRLVTCPRARLLGDADWYGSVEYNEIFRRQMVDDFVNCHTRTADRSGLFGFQFIRPARDRRFNPSERRLVRLFMTEVDRYLGTALAREPPRTEFESLPPRLRQVLGCLLDGDGEKQAATRLGISRHTAHEYVAALYRRLGVNSRAELFALCRKFPPPNPPPAPSRR